MFSIERGFVSELFIVKVKLMKNSKNGYTSRINRVIDHIKSNLDKGLSLERWASKV
jgi:hypothetical protein